MRWWHRLTSITRSGLLVCSLLFVALLGLVAGWTWLAAPSVLGVLGAASAAAGVDSRRPGDWTRTEPP